MDKALAGDRNALARLLSLIERASPEAVSAMSLVHRRPEDGYYVGVTGPPGTGKSTLVDKLTLELRKRDHSVGIVAVDPSSPFSGGSVLGDRIRMQRHALDPGVFIRSLASRGSLGGLSRAARDSARVLNCAGRDFCFIETVGAGQVEVDIAGTADTTVVVLMPETGDGIQAIKGGILEIADILAVNKADLPGADRLVSHLQYMLREDRRLDWWEVPVLTVQAAKNLGVAELLEKIEEHRHLMREQGRLVERRRERRERELMEIIERELSDRLALGRREDALFQEVVRMVGDGAVDPHTAAAELLRDRSFLERWFLGATPISQPGNSEGGHDD